MVVDLKAQEYSKSNFTPEPTLSLPQKSASGIKKLMEIRTGGYCPSWSVLSLLLES